VSFELYNLKDDIGQKQNLANKEPQRLAEMQDKLAKFYAQIQEQMPAWDLPIPMPPVAKPKSKQ
jgi:hypothetical protein